MNAGEKSAQILKTRVQILILCCALSPLIDTLPHFLLKNTILNFIRKIVCKFTFYFAKLHNCNYSVINFAKSYHCQ